MKKALGKKNCLQISIFGSLFLFFLFVLVIGGSGCSGGIRLSAEGGISSSEARSITTEAAQITINNVFTANQTLEGSLVLEGKLQSSVVEYPLEGCLKICEEYLIIDGTITSEGVLDIIQTEGSLNDANCEFSQQPTNDDSLAKISTQTGSRGGTCEVRLSGEILLLNFIDYPDSVTGLINQVTNATFNGSIITINSSGTDTFSDSSACVLKSNILVTVPDDNSNEDSPNDPVVQCTQADSSGCVLLLTGETCENTSQGQTFSYSGLSALNITDSQIGCLYETNSMDQDNCLFLQDTASAFSECNVNLQSDSSTTLNYSSSDNDVRIGSSIGSVVVYFPAGGDEGNFVIEDPQGNVLVTGIRSEAGVTANGCSRATMTSELGSHIINFCGICDIQGFSNINFGFASSPGLNCITDDDGDGILDESDNCSNISNSNQVNSDMDIYGDACDAFINDSAAH